MIVCWGDDSVLGVVQCAVLCCAQQDRAGQVNSTWFTLAEWARCDEREYKGKHVIATTSCSWSDLTPCSPPEILSRTTELCSGGAS